jgi:hypothetical protein
MSSKPARKENQLRKVLVRLLRQSPAMVVAMLALFVALTGTAVATTSALITGNQIKNSSITGLDVKNKSLTPRDFRGSVRGPRGLRGLTGATGAAGAAGAKGDKGDKGDPASRKRTRLHYEGTNTDNTITFSYELIRTVGVFTKDFGDTAIRLTWVGHVEKAGTFCEFQLRVDGLKDTGSASTAYEGTSGGSAVSYTNNSPVGVTAIFTGFAPGAHTVSIWVRGNATACTLNNGDFGQDVWVEEAL